MFELSYKIKDEIEFNNQVYKVNMSFDNVLRFYDMMEDEELNAKDKVNIGINMFLGKTLECDEEELINLFNQIIETFLKGESEPIKLDRKGNPLPVKKLKPVYDFKHDAEYIYASFIQAYGVDLIGQQGILHWLKFKALLNGLPEDTKFRHVIDIRTRELPKGKGSSEERKALKELKRIYALPDVEVDDEK